MSSPIRVLVAGSRGFIGAAVARHLRAAGAHVLEAGRSNGVELSSWASVSTLPDCDVLLHIAGRTQVPDSAGDPLPFFRDNVVSTLHLLELARRRNCRFVLASSYVYGTPRYLPIDESHPVSASGPYMNSKIAAEQLCDAYHRDHHLPVVVLRIFNAYGPGQGEHLLVPTIVSGIRRGLLRLGNPTSRRDFVHVDDVARAFELAIEKCQQGFEVFNIGSGASVAVHQLVDMMRSLSGRDVPVEYGTYFRPGDIRDVVAAIGKARRVLGWQPTVGLEAGLRRVLDVAFQPTAPRP